MRVLANLATVLVALLHLGFMALEMVFWTQDLGQDIFGTTPEFAAESASLAFNQGLYNGFLAAGLLWGVVAGKRDVTLFFLLCVIIAWIVGGLTASMGIIVVQAVPGAAALLLTLLARRSAG